MKPRVAQQSSKHAFVSAFIRFDWLGFLPFHIPAQ